METAAHPWGAAEIVNAAADSLSHDRAHLCAAVARRVAEPDDIGIRGKEGRVLGYGERIGHADIN